MMLHIKYQGSNGFRQYFFMFPVLKKASEYGQEIPQSHSADQPTCEPRGGTICGPMGII